MQLKINFANDDRLMRFSLKRYLAQRFPPLRKRPVTTIEEVCRWNDDILGDLPDEDRGFLNREPFQIGQHFSVDLGGKSTIKAALGAFDDLIVDVLRESIPPSAIEKLANWLQRQWSLYWPRSASNVDWEAYLWRYIRMANPSWLEIEGVRQTISPLIGHVEVFPAGVQCHEGDFSIRWRYEEYLSERNGAAPVKPIASITDPIEFAFSHQVHAYDADGEPMLNSDGSQKRNWYPMDQRWRWPEHDWESGEVVRDDDGEPVFDEYDNYSLYLFVRYKGASLSSEFLNQNNVFFSFASALHPRDHWAVKHGEVGKSQTTSILGSMIPTHLRRSLENELPQIHRGLSRVANAVSEMQQPLRDSIWLDPAVQAAIKQNAKRELEDQRSPRKYRNSIDLFLGDLHDDSPLAPSSQELSGEHLEGDMPASMLGIENWQEGLLLPNELDQILASLRQRRQQDLLTSHLELASLLEMTIRQLKSGSNGRFQIDEEFCRWVGQYDGKLESVNRRGRQVDQHKWSSPIYAELFRGKSFLRGNFDPATGLASFDRLSSRVSQIVADSSAAATSLGIDKLGVALSTLISTPAANVGSTQWNETLFAICEADDQGFGNLIFAGKLIFQIRNLLIHGVPFEEQPESDSEIAVVNYESGIAVLLDGDSLTQCFRIITAILCAIVRHNSNDSSELEYLVNVVQRRKTDIV